MRGSPNKLVMHGDGTMSVRIGGRWRKRIIELSPNDYLALKRDDREKIVLAEFVLGRTRVMGSRVIVSRAA
jgi:hypothetical protein